MARRRQETDDEITEADDTAGAATFGGAPTRGTRQVTPPSVPDDLRTALAPSFNQVILDTDIDCFNHPDTGPALMQAAAKYPENPPSDDDSA